MHMSTIRDGNGLSITGKVTSGHENRWQASFAAIELLAVLTSVHALPQIMKIQATSVQRQGVRERTRRGVGGDKTDTLIASELLHLHGVLSYEPVYDRDYR